MAQEYFINSQELQSKVDSLLPSQGGAGAGFDLSASTQIVPIIDLTESAEGSNLRSDLQRSFSFSNTSISSTTNTTNTIITNTGFFRIFGNAYLVGAGNIEIRLKDATSSKSLLIIYSQAGNDKNEIVDLNVFLKAGDTVDAFASSNSVNLFLATRQIADITGQLVDPT